MFAIADAFVNGFERNEPLAVATVIAVVGSAPRALGTSMAVDAQGKVTGSLSGGCLEGAVYEACLDVLSTGKTRVEDFGLVDDDPFAIGLSCGGRIRVCIQKFHNDRQGVDVAHQLRLARRGKPAGLAMVIAPATQSVTVVSQSLAFDGDLNEDSNEVLPPVVRDRVTRALRTSMRAGRSSSTTFDCDGVLFDVCCLIQAPPPRMIIFGAVDFASALSSAARLLGYQVTICDARSRFAIRSRFPDADVVVRWPVDYLANTAVDERTVVCIVTHDDKFDVPLIELALTLPVRYVGAMGSRITHQRRMAALLERGHTHRELSSLHSPIGLDLGAETVEETAISILAEVLVTQSGASGASLSTRSGPIHQGSSDAEAFAAVPTAPPDSRETN